MNDKAGDLVSNRRALHNYEVLESWEAGMVLTGTEIKSLRDHGGSLQDAYVRISDREAWLINCSIAPYRFGNVYNHAERRERKLLLHRNELLKLQSATQEKGLTIIPLSIYLRKGKAKIKIALAKGKKAIDKRDSIRERDENRSIARAMRRDFD